MDVADDNAYSTYDIEDVFDARFLTPLSILGTDDSIKEEITGRIQKKIELEFSDLPEPERQFSIDDLNAGLQQVFATILGIDGDVVFGREWGLEDLATYVGSEVFRASDLLAHSKYHRTQFTSDLVGFFINSVDVAEVGDNPIFWQVRPRIDAFAAIETLKQIAYNYLIMSNKFLAERRRAKHIIESIFNALLESGSDLLTEDWRLVYEFYRDDDDQKRRTICDFVSGMTNRYCIEFYERLFGPRPPSIHKP